MSVLEFQTVCIRFLIEMNGHLQETGLEKEVLHDRLNEVLQQLLCCENSQDVLRWMLSYLEWVTRSLEHADNHQISGGVVAENSELYPSALSGKYQFEYVGRTVLHASELFE